MKNSHIAALTGGISTGKSTISNYFKDRYGFYLVDADKIGHEVLTYPDIVDSISREFGKETSINGKVDRKILGSIVFSDPLKLSKLNGITHHALINRALEILEKLNDRPVIFEAAVLIEAGWHKHFDTVILTTCSPEIQILRTMERNKLSREDAVKRINSQISDEIRRQYADFIIDTSKGPKPVEEQLDMIARTLLKEIS